jgi:hypothetical protein
MARAEDVFKLERIQAEEQGRVMKITDGQRTYRVPARSLGEPIRETETEEERIQAYEHWRSRNQIK